MNFLQTKMRKIYFTHPLASWWYCLIRKQIKFHNCKKVEYQLRNIHSTQKTSAASKSRKTTKDFDYQRQKGKWHEKPRARGKSEQGTWKIKLKPTYTGRRDFVNIQNWCYSVCLESIAKRNWSSGRMTLTETYTVARINYPHTRARNRINFAFFFIMNSLKYNGVFYPVVRRL